MNEAEARPEEIVRRVRYITEQFRQRNIGFDQLGTSFGIHAFHQTPTTVQVTSYRTRVLVWANNLNSHDGLKQFRTSLTSSFAETTTGSEFKRQGVRVNIVE